jgi:hypothetical protein
VKSQSLDVAIIVAKSPSTTVYSYTALVVSATHAVFLVNDLPLIVTLLSLKLAAVCCVAVTTHAAYVKSQSLDVAIIVAKSPSTTVYVALALVPALPAV